MEQDIGSDQTVEMMDGRQDYLTALSLQYITLGLLTILVDALLPSISRNGNSYLLLLGNASPYTQLTAQLDRHSLKKVAMMPKSRTMPRGT